MKKTTKSQESAVNPVVENVNEVDTDVVNEAVEEIKAEGRYCK